MKTLFFIVVYFFTITIYASNNYKTNILQNSFEYTSQTPRSISFNSLIQGCPSIDCIPSVDLPEFETVNSVSYLRNRDIMMIVEYNGITKIYPRKIMQIHEIVNDYFLGKPLVVTYCPLCGTSIAFLPFIDGKRVEFGVSGLLHNSDLVMYDRETKSLWQQITGRAIVGEMTGTKLKMVSVGLLTWKEVKEVLPDALVLKRPMKKKRLYKTFIYENYESSSKLDYPVKLQDARLYRKNVVYGIDVEGKYIALEEKYLRKRTPYVESFGKYTLKVTYKEGKVFAIDMKTDKTFDVVRGYWFAWYSFHPDTILRK